MRRRRELVGMAGILLVLLTASLGRADFLHGFWQWATGQPPKQPEDPKSGAVVSEVVVQGSYVVPTRTVLAQVLTRPGAPFSQPLLEKDLQTLRDSRWFSAVTADLHADGPGRVKVCFLVRDHAQKVEKVTFVGARAFSGKDLEGRTAIRAGSPIDPNLNRAACRKIVELYHQSSRPFATCALLKGGASTDTEVLFSITEGPKVSVRDVRIDGNNCVSSGSLSARVRSRNAVQADGGKFDSTLAEADVGELEKYYRSLGYDHVQVSRELVWDEGGRTVTLVFHIDEGLRYRAADPPPPPAASTADASSGIRLASQQSVAPAKDLPSMKIGKIHVAGNRATPSSLIVAQSGLASGQVVTDADLRKAEEELAKLKFLEVDAARDVRPTVTVLGSEGEVKDLLIFVKEKEAR